MIIGALIPLPLVESMTRQLGELLLKVADLQHRIAPVGGAAPDEPSSSDKTPEDA